MRLAPKATLNEVPPTRCFFAGLSTRGFIKEFENAHNPALVENTFVSAPVSHFNSTCLLSM